MNSTTGNTVHPPAAKVAPSNVRTSLLARFNKYVGQDLLTLLLVLATLMIVIRSVESAQWVATPSLVLPLVLAVLAGFWVARNTRSRFREHSLVALVGIIILYYQGSTLVEQVGWLERFTVLNSRLWAWWKAIVGQDASPDVLPFALVLVLFTWVVGYWCTWLLFRRKNVWWVIIPSSVFLIGNLSWLPQSYYVYLFAYLAAALLLVAHVTALSRTVLQRGGTVGERPFPSYLPALRHAVWIGALVLALTMTIPITGWTNFLMVEASEKFLAPIDKMRVELNRFFAVGSKIPTSLKHFGSVLPVHRPIPNGDEPILLSSHQMPAYWRLRSYSDYTSTAWRVRETDFDSLAPMVIPGSLENFIALQEEHDIPERDSPYNLSYVHVKLLADAPFLLVAGNVKGLDLYEINKTASAQVHEPITYKLSMEDLAANEDLPSDLKSWATELSAASDPAIDILDWVQTTDDSSQKVTKVISQGDDGKKRELSLDPSSITYTEDLKRSLDGNVQLQALEIQRGPPLMGDVLAVRTKPQLGEDQGYGFAPDISIPSAEALRNSGQDYPSWIADRYLTLPPSVPERVKELAVSLTAGLTNPYDKAVAIEEYLRGLTYTNDPEPIAYDVDAADSFLFETQKGHSDHFTSAMAVMARSLGIPSRLALGYGPGEDDPEQRAFVVRDRDSHTWPEVYFPGAGWIEFEPSPIYTRRPRDVSQTESLMSPLDASAGPGTVRNVAQPDDLEQEIEETPPASVGGRLPDGLGPFPSPLLHFGTPLGRDGVYFGLIIVTIAFLSWVIWKRYFWELRRPGEAYLRLMRLTIFLGLPSHPSETPFELAQRVSSIVPQAEEDIYYICDSFSNATYAGRRARGLDRIRVARAWYRVRQALMKQLLHERSPSESQGGPLSTDFAGAQYRRQ